MGGRVSAAWALQKRRGKRRVKSTSLLCRPRQGFGLEDTWQVLARTWRRRVHPHDTGISLSVSFTALPHTHNECPLCLPFQPASAAAATTTTTAMYAASLLPLVSKMGWIGDRLGLDWGLCLCWGCGWGTQRLAFVAPCWDDASLAEQSDRPWYWQVFSSRLTHRIGLASALANSSVPIPSCIAWFGFPSRQPHHREVSLRSRRAPSTGTKWQRKQVWGPPGALPCPAPIFPGHYLASTMESTTEHGPRGAS